MLSEKFVTSMMTVGGGSSSKSYKRAAVVEDGVIGRSSSSDAMATGGGFSGKGTNAGAGADTISGKISLKLVTTSQKGTLKLPKLPSIGEIQAYQLCP